MSDLLKPLNGIEKQFEAFVLQNEPRLHAAYVARYGHHKGREATAEALAYAWEHWGRVQAMDNAMGYLFRVGQSRVRERSRRAMYLPPSEHYSAVEPNLLPALAALSDKQRMAVVLVHVEGWTLREVAELLHVSIPTVQKNADRGLANLRRSLHIEISERSND
jgi:DNA-directed RNA polymerase specialized sigma24 family protein